MRGVNIKTCKFEVRYYCKGFIDEDDDTVTANAHYDSATGRYFHYVEPECYYHCYAKSFSEAKEKWKAYLGITEESEYLCEILQIVRVPMNYEGV